MSTEVFDWRCDSPWRRLPWTLPGAVVFGGVVLWALASFMREPADRPPEPSPIEAQVIELPPPAPVAEPAKPEPPKPAPAKRAPAPIQPRTPPHPEPAQPTAAPSPSAATPAPPPPRPVLPQAEGGAAMSGNSGAQAILRPLPRIPDDLREEAMDAAAVARFHVAVDGSATVELARPTQNPRLNRLLLDTLKTWRFFPALKDGKPVASTEEIVVRIQVK